MNKLIVLFYFIKYTINSKKKIKINNIIKKIFR